MSKPQVPSAEESPSTPERRVRGRMFSSQSESVQSCGFTKLRDLSAARMERRQTTAQPTTSLSSDNISTAFKVQKVAKDWMLMKQNFHKDFESLNASQVSLSESDSQSSALRLVSMLKASSSATAAPKSLNRSMSVATSKKMLFKRKASSPLRSATPLQGNSLLSKLVKFSGQLATGPKKPPKKARPVIEVSLFSARSAPTRPPAPKPEKRKPRLIEVSMTKS